MSAPQGPRVRGGNRGRGSARAGPRNGEGERAAGRPTHNAVLKGDGSQQQIKPPPRQGQVRNKSWRNPGPLKSAIQSHAGKLPDSQKQSWRDSARTDGRTYKQQMFEHYQTLKENREKERKAAIMDGFLADPEKPTSLANAITPVGICQEMCPEFERVERIVQLMVDANEKMPSSLDPDSRVPREDIMVKRFRRSAAGYDEQLPSDIRPPAVLKMTLDYLFEDIVGGPEPLANVHKFVWDRTRGIRNDFSIQQVTKKEDLKIAIDCFERIARFHILSLHQLSRQDADNGEFDHHQEREQLNNTLLSLMYYYDDSRHKLQSPNEPEFRAYCIIFEIQDQRPDLEDRAQNWPKRMLKDPRVQTALRLYAAAGNTSDEQGPLRPRTPFATAQANTGGFWSVVRSNAISYMMACIAEIYFNLVRRTALEAIWKAYKGKRGGPTKMEDWTLRDLTVALGFDMESQTQDFCEEHGFEIDEREDGELYLDLGSVSSGILIDHNPRRKQIFSRDLVERKRLSRTLPAVINGVTASQAQAQGLVTDLSDAETASVADSESLFITGESDEEKATPRSRSASPMKGKDSKIISQQNSAAKPSNPFASNSQGPSTSNVFPANGTFGRPSSTPMSTLFQPNSNSIFSSDLKSSEAATNGLKKEPPKFDFFANRSSNTVDEAKSSSQTFIDANAPKFDFSKAVDFSPSNNKNPFENESQEKPRLLGQPSATLPKSNHANLPKFIFDPPASNQSPYANNVPKNVLTQPQPSQTPPTFSFGTSSLFDLKAAPQGGQSRHVSTPTDNKLDASSTIQDTSISKSSSLFPSAALPGPKLPGPIQSTPSPTSATSGWPQSTTFSNKSFPAVPSPSVTAESPYNQKSSTYSPSAAISPGPQSTELSAEPPKAIPTTSPSNTKRTTQAPQKPPAPRASEIDPRALLIDMLSEAVMLGSNGLLQQFIEFAVGPIITSSIAQLEDEQSWEKAKMCRAIILRKKYFRRWRTKAWNLNLMRKGRERRRNFAQSIQQASRSSTIKPLDFTSSLASILHHPTGSRPAQVIKAAATLPPPLQHQKRHSLPSEFTLDHTNPGTAKGQKRKREDTVNNTNEATPRPQKINHRRSQTLGDATMSAPPHTRVQQTPLKSRMNLSTAPEAPLLHDTLMRQARRLAPNVKADTTRTDYFKLKALGINPDTSVVPLTKKQAREEAAANGVPASPLNQSNLAFTAAPPPNQPAIKVPRTPSNAPHKSSANNDDDDEALFAQIRSVREALAESEQWMASERQSIERSQTPRSNSFPPEPESPAQRRLREIQERVYTPSRSEIRLRAMGDRALLPKGFWDGEGMGRSSVGKGKGKEKEKDEEKGTSVVGLRGGGLPGGQLMGFARIEARQRQVNGVGGNGAEKTGASVEDAIEL